MRVVVCGLYLYFSLFEFSLSLSRPHYPFLIHKNKCVSNFNNRFTSPLELLLVQPPLPAAALRSDLATAPVQHVDTQAKEAVSFPVSNLHDAVSVT